MQEQETENATINHCVNEPISIDLTEGEPVSTDVISQFTDISTTGNSYQWGTLSFRYRTFEGGGIYVMLENLPMDKYLYGLAEVPPSWPTAALESQAIAGRTYAYKRVLSRRNNAASISDCSSSMGCKTGSSGHLVPSIPTTRLDASRNDTGVARGQRYSEPCEGNLRYRNLLVTRWSRLERSSRLFHRRRELRL